MNIKDFLSYIPNSKKKPDKVKTNGRWQGMNRWYETRKGEGHSDEYLATERERYKKLRYE